MDFSIPELDKELLARGARLTPDEQPSFNGIPGTPARENIMAQIEELYLPENAPLPNDALSHVTLWQLAEALFLKIREEEHKKALRGEGLRLDMYEISDPHIQRNARAVASIWMKENVKNTGNNLFALQYQPYGKSFNLCLCEPYYHQPIVAGRLCTGFLIKPDVIATAGHCADEKNVKNLCFVFGYEMKQADYPVTQVPDRDIYHGVEILQRVYNPMGNGTDWALVKLDRNVSNRETLSLATTDIHPSQGVYVLGYPSGLPLKYIPEEPVNTMKETFFSAELSVYSGNSGSPVFCKDSHQVVGIVVRGDQQDFRWTGKGWMSIRYPNSMIKSNAPQCTKVSQFLSFCR